MSSNRLLYQTDPLGNGSWSYHWDTPDGTAPAGFSDFMSALRHAGGDAAAWAQDPDYAGAFLTQGGSRDWTSMAQPGYINYFQNEWLPAQKAAVARANSGTMLGDMAKVIGPLALAAVGANFGAGLLGAGELSAAEEAAMLGGNLETGSLGAGMEDMAAAGFGGESSAIDAAKSALEKYLTPQQLASSAGKQITSRVVSNLLRGNDPFEGINLENLAAGTALGGLNVAGTGALSSLGLSPTIASGVSRAGLAALQGRNPTNALMNGAMGYGLGQLGAPASLAPVVSGLAQGRRIDLPGTLANIGVSTAAHELPPLRWPKKD